MTRRQFGAFVSSIGSGIIGSTGEQAGANTNQQRFCVYRYKDEEVARALNPGDGHARRNLEQARKVLAH